MLKTCDICNTQFDGHHAAKRCSDACKKQAIAEYQAAYYEANKESIAEYQAAYNAANKESIAEKNSAYREANKESIAEYRAAYYEANKESTAKQQAAYNAANKEAIAKKQAAYREANKEAIARHRQTPAGKAAQSRANAKRRGAAVRESDPTFIKADRCVRCGSIHDLEVEHMTPVSQGGTDYIENKTTMCRDCNRGIGGKFTKGPQDWPAFVAWFLWNE